MGVMGISAWMVFALVVISTLVSCTSAFDGYDGRPRPTSMADQPTKTLGAQPAVMYAGKPANCIWYDWENPYYSPMETKNCSDLLWASLSAADPSTLQGYTYYMSNDFYVPQYKEYLCVIGCFDLSATSSPSPAPSTSSSAATPPVAATPPAMSPPLATPPAVAPAAPPMTPPSTPPPMMAPPPPATLFRPPPPALPLPPSTVVPPATGPSRAPGPATQASAGSALRIFSAASILVISAAVLGLTL